MLCSLIKTLCSHHQWLDLIADSSSCRDTHPDILWRQSLNWRSSLVPNPKVPRTLPKMGRKDSMNHRRWRTPGGHGTLNQLSKANRDSQRLKQQSQGCKGLHQVLCIIFFFCLLVCIIVGLLTVRAGGSMTFLWHKFGWEMKTNIQHDT